MNPQKGLVVMVDPWIFLEIHVFFFKVCFLKLVVNLGLETPGEFYEA